jgi:hypothetical protein
VLGADTIAVRGAFAGTADDAWRALSPLFLDEPLTDSFRAMSYAETATIGGTPPRHFELLHELPSEALLALDGTVEVKRWGGAIARGATPAGHRRVPFSATVDGDDIAPLRPHVTGGAFLNWLKDTSRTHAAYTPSDLARLLELKRAYDPQNVFGVGHQLVPTRRELALVA